MYRSRWKPRKGSKITSIYRIPSLVEWGKTAYSARLR